jgi:hypothetical protein
MKIDRKEKRQAQNQFDAATGIHAMEMGRGIVAFLVNLKPHTYES